MGYVVDMVQGNVAQALMVGEIRATIAEARNARTAYADALKASPLDPDRINTIDNQIEHLERKLCRLTAQLLRKLFDDPAYDPQVKLQKEAPVKLLGG